jgi:hypothetical protein
MSSLDKKCYLGIWETPSSFSSIRLQFSLHFFNTPPPSAMTEKFEPLSSVMSSPDSSESLLDEKRRSEDSSFIEDIVLLDQHQQQRRGTWKRWALPLTFHLLLIGIYTAVTLVLLERNNRWWRNGPHLVHSPARAAHDYERVTFDGFFTSKNPYKGEWRPELDDAWGTLLENSNIVVSKDDLDRINKTSVEVPDGSGYLATLDVYHQVGRHYVCSTED